MKTTKCPPNMNIRVKKHEFLLVSSFCINVQEFIPQWAIFRFRVFRRSRKNAQRAKSFYAFHARWMRAPKSRLCLYRFITRNLCIIQAHRNTYDACRYTPLRVSSSTSMSARLVLLFVDDERSVTVTKAIVARYNAGLHTCDIYCARPRSRLAWQILLSSNHNTAKDAISIVSMRYDGTTTVVRAVHAQFFLYRANIIW